MKLDIESNNDEISSEINMTPLIDIMMVLLVIFLVTSTISLESGLDIDLPKTSSDTKAKNDSSLIISMNKVGSIAVGGKIVGEQDLEVKIKEELQKLGTTSVIFEGDQGARLGKAIEIMDIAKRAGASQFAIAAEEK